jgi:ATP-dependent DNA ligase
VHVKLEKIWRGSSGRLCRPMPSSSIPPHKGSKYDGNRALVQVGDAVLDAEHIAWDGHEGTLYDLNSTRKVPRSYRYFDVLTVGEMDLRTVGFQERHDVLLELSHQGKIADGELAECILVGQNLADIMAGKKLALDRNFEGIVVKPYHSLYRPKAWVKLKRIKSADLAVLAIKRTKAYEQDGIAETFLLGHWDPQGNRWKPDTLTSAGLSKMQKRELAKRAMDVFTHKDKTFVYVKPDSFPPMEVQYKCRMPNGLREPRIIRLRDDKRPQDCTNEPN